MTHYAALSEALTRATNTPGRPLVFRGTAVHLRDFIDQYEHISQDRFLEQHSAVRSEQIRIVSDLYSDILMDSDSEADARRQLRQQADWALLSEAVSREIERGPVKLSDPPSARQFLDLAWSVADDIRATPAPAAERPSCGMSRRGNQSRTPGESETLPCPSREARDQLTDACMRLERAIEQLRQASHPALAAYVLSLVNRLDEVQGEVTSGRDRR